MKSLCLILVLALTMPGCSMLTKSGRQERAYSKYVKKMQTARAPQRSRVIHQRAELPDLRTQAPMQETAQTSESQ